MELLTTKVYIASTRILEEEQTFQKIYQSVPKERQEKVDRLRFPQEKRQSLAAAYLLDLVLKEHGIDYYKIGYDRKGKPLLEGLEGIYFNLSHSDERVMCVISGKETGCDVEKAGQDRIKIAKRFFTEREYHLLESCLEEEERSHMFFKIWTLKESYLKATGRGLRQSMKEFEFAFQQDKIVMTTSFKENQNVKQDICMGENRKCKQEEYYFEGYLLKDGYHYAICSKLPKIEDPVVLF